MRSIRTVDKRNPLSPCRFDAAVEFAAGEQTAARKFASVAYSGDVVVDHPLWDRVAFDLSSTKAAKTVPVLLNHEHPVGVGSVSIGNDVKADGTLFSDVDANAKSIVEKAERGMPWQQSVYIKPGRIDHVKAGQSVELNGRTLQGPLAVFRNNRIREVSFCALGADHQTEAHVFAIGGQRAATSEEKDTMDHIEKAEHDRVVAELNGKLEAAEAKFTAEKARADDAVAALATFKLEGRVAAVKALFADTKRDYKDDAAKPYLEMSEEAFAVVAADLRASSKPADAHLFREQATNGDGSSDTPTTVEEINGAALKFIAEQAKLGREVSVSDAVRHVTTK